MCRETKEQTYCECNHKCYWSKNLYKELLKAK